MPIPAPDEGASLRPRQWFATTHWSVVVSAADTSAPGGQAALEELCRTYWYPLYAYVRRQGHCPEDAQDLTQEFFYNFLRRESLTNLSPLAGKFRSYLLASLKHFLSNRRRDGQTQRRGAGIQVISLDASAADDQFLIDAADNVTPEVLFERRWAFTVLDQAIEELRREYARRANSEMFDDLRGFLTCSDGTLSRAKLAEKHGISAGAIDVAIHRLRQRFGTLLREQIVRTVSSPNEVEEELRHLISILDR
jgi:RNA polymerase sigma-70 factor (ECF subfamily)